MSTDSLATREPLVLGAPAPVLAAGGAVLALLLAVTEVVLGRAQIASWPAEVAALLALVAGGAVVAVRASPFRTPFRRRTHALVLGLVLAAVVLDEVAQEGRNAVVHDDWGLAVVPVFLLALAVLRPPREVLVGGLLAVAVVAVAVLVLPPAHTAPVPPLPRVGVAITQVLPPALAAAALSRITSRRLAPGRPADPPAASADAALSVRQETVARLEADAIPLLRTVATTGTVTAEQAERARTIAAGLRTALVDALARGWLAELGVAVDDPDGYAERLTTQQRTALRTTIASLPLADFDAPGTAVVRGQDRQAAVELVLPVAAPPRRSRVAPLVPLLRTVFSRADIRVADDRVVVAVEVVVPR